MPFFSWSDIPGRRRAPTRLTRVISGERGTLLRVEHDGPSEHAIHSHDENEQISTVIEGEVEFTAGGETRLMKPGDVVVLPPGTPHGLRVAPGVRAVVLEFAAPPREDMR